MHTIFRKLCILLVTSFALPAFAQTTVEIAGSGENRIGVAVAGFPGEEVLPTSLTEVIRADLERSGMFRLVETSGLPLGEAASPDFASWRSRGADILLYGRVIRRADAHLEVRFRLQDAVKQTVLAEPMIVFTPEFTRGTAHRIADLVYEKLIGEAGIFTTRIAYVAQSGGKYRLRVADADGANAQDALSSNEPIISPVWAPNGRQVAYVSFHLKKPVVFIQDLTRTELPTVLANFRGSNSSPAWAPDGKRLAVVLTKDGSSQIYLINADGTGVKRLMESFGIDTEPVFSPDGKFIYFTSDRGGSPQIYRVGVAGGEAQRVTFEGAYNVSPTLSPDGRTLAYVTQTEVGYRIALLDLSNGQTLVLPSDSTRDTSPSFAPNGRYLLYASERGNQSVLMMASRDGRVRQRLSGAAAGVQQQEEPAWGPFSR